MTRATTRYGHGGQDLVSRPVHVWPEIAWTDNPADVPPPDLEKE